MDIVFVHRHGAGQFQPVATHLAARGAKVTVVCESPAAHIPGARVITHAPVASRLPSDRGLGHLAVADWYVQRGYRVAEVLDRLRRAEGAPDMIVGHIGWGGLLFVKDALPRTPALGYCEYYFEAAGGDLGFDPAEPPTMAELGRARVRNMVQKATLDAIEAGVSATGWQRSRYPLELRPRIAVCHEGVDLAICHPDPQATFRLPDGRILKKGDPVVTYVARGLEPYRGFPQFMRAAARVASRSKDAIFVVAGSDTVAYGRPPKEGGNWRETMLAETGIDPSRIVFLGTVDHARLIRLFQVSAAHVYLTVPFVLSWSMLEAMACGCLIIGSATAPVQEVIGHGRNGLLTGFFDSDALATLIQAALARSASLEPLRRMARATIEERFDRRNCLTRQVTLLGRLGSMRRAPSFVPRPAAISAIAGLGA